MSLEEWASEIFGEEVSLLFQAADGHRDDRSKHIMVPYEVCVRFNVFVSKRHHGVFYHFHAGGVVFEEYGWFLLWKTKFLQ